MNYFLSILLFFQILVYCGTSRVPMFHKEILVKKIFEEQPIGTFVVRTTAVDADGEEVGYEILQDKNKLFKIDSKSGSIYTAAVIDRESLISSTIKFKIAAYEIGNTERRSYQDARIHVMDINDNTPQFDEKRYAINISESTERNEYVGRVRAHDKDKNAELLYSIEDGNSKGYFKIGTYTGQIQTSKKLDYEKEKFFQLSVAVTDGRPSDPLRHTARTTVFINVIDVDDNGPIFESNYTAVIYEGEHKGQFIAKVFAYDQDRGINSPVSYSIDPRTNIDGLFSIDRSGNVYVNGVIDREETPDFTLKLLAMEQQPSLQIHRPAKTYLRVRIKDINDSRPKFKSKTFIGRVKEHAPIGHIVMKVIAIDKDLGENSIFRYELADGGDKTFGISQTGDIMVKKDLDREKKYIYEFKVLAIEDGFPEISEAQVTIIVDDENDHDPIFNKNLYTASIKENQPSGLYVTSVTAVDEDKGVNAKVRYSIVPDAKKTSACFYIDPEKGTLKTLCSFDREKRDTYSLLVQATDSGAVETRRYHDTVVKVIIEDENDNAPKFKQQEYFKTLPFDVAINTLICQVQAEDKDSGTYGQVSYRIVSGNEQGRFFINKNSGELKVSESLTASSGRFSLQIEAFDNQGYTPSLTSKQLASVVVTVDQLGENNVVIVTQSSVRAILRNEDKFLSELKDIFKFGVVIDKIRRKGAQECEIIIHGYNEDTYEVIPKHVILNTLDSNFDELEKMKIHWNFTEWFAFKAIVTENSARQSTSERDVNNWNPVIYAVLGFSAIIVVFGMIGIIYLLRTKRRNCEDPPPSLSSSHISVPRKTPNSFWSDSNHFESVSQVGASDNLLGDYLDRSFSRYECDPSNMYTHRGIGDEDPFSRSMENRSLVGSPTSGRASSIFAASSVMTVFKAPNRDSNASRPTRGSKRNAEEHTSAEESRLSVIEDMEARSHSESLLQRPPSYEYDLDDIVTSQCA